MNKFAFVFLALLIFVAAPKLAPSIVSIETYKVAGCKQNDPLGTCEGERVTILNPLMDEAVVVIACGDEFDSQDVTVPARTKLTVDIELTLPTKHPACRMAGWISVHRR